MFRLEIETGDAAFEENEAAQREIARILREVAESVEGWSGYASAEYSGRIKDVNGNTVGTWQYTPE